MKTITLLQYVSKLPCMACPPPLPEDLSWVLENIEIAKRTSDPHHVTSRGAGGKDSADNVMPLCRDCHTKWHSIGGKEMARLYPGVRAWLEAAGRIGDFVDGDN